MHFTNDDSEEQGIKDVEKGVKEFEEGLRKEERQLRDLFLTLKTDLIDQLLLPGPHAMKDGQVGVLEQQVRHVINVAKSCGFTELEHAFEEENNILKSLRQVLEHHPDIDISTRPDLRENLEHLRSMIRHQQGLIFDHERVLRQEQERLVDILEQVQGLKQDVETDRHLTSSQNEPTPQDRQYN